MRLLLIMCLAMLVGCAEINIVRTTVGKWTEQIGDTVVNDSLWYLCNKATVASIRKHFNTPDLKKSYNEMCPGRSPFFVEEG